MTDECLPVSRGIVFLLELFNCLHAQLLILGGFFTVIVKDALGLFETELGEMVNLLEEMEAFRRNLKLFFQERFTFIDVGTDDNGNDLVCWDNVF